MNTNNIDNLVQQSKYNLKLIKQDIVSLNLHVHNAMKIENELFATGIMSVPHQNQHQLTPVKYDRNVCRKIQEYTKAIHKLTSVLKSTKKKSNKKSKKFILEKYLFNTPIKTTKSSIDNSVRLFKPDFTSTPNYEQPKTSTPEKTEFCRKQYYHHHHHHHHYHHQEQHLTTTAAATPAAANQFKYLKFTPNLYETHSYKAKKSSYIIINNKQNYMHKRSQVTEIRQTKLCFH